jgi:hypothetical protein
MMCFLGKAAIFLPPSIVDRNVLGSNLLRFLAATLGFMMAPLNGANAQNVNVGWCSYEEGWMNTERGANQCQQNCDPLDEDNDFTLGVGSQLSHFPDFAARRDRSCVGSCACPSNGSGLPALLGVSMFQEWYLGQSLALLR